MLRRIANKIQSIFCSVIIKGSDNNYKSKSKIGRNFKIRVSGSNNQVNIGKDCLLTNTKVLVSGNNCKLIIEDKVRFIGPCKIIMEIIVL